MQYGKLAVSTKCRMCVWEIIIAEGERGYRHHQNWSQGYRHHQNLTDYRGLGVIKTGLVTRVHASSKLDWLQGCRHHQNRTGHRGTGVIKTGLITRVQASSKRDWLQGYRYHQNWTTTNVPSLKNKRPTWYHLLFYLTFYVLNMFRTLIYIHLQELATILLNYHIGRIVLGSMCFGVSVWLGWSGIRVAGWSSLQHGYHSNPTTPKLQHTSNQEQYDQCGNSTE